MLEAQRGEDLLLTRQFRVKCARSNPKKSKSSFGASIIRLVKDAAPDVVCAIYRRPVLTVLQGDIHC